MAPNLKPRAPLQIWAGIECTINRVGDVFFDQCKKNGHTTRAGDLKLIRGLGVTTLRYPFLWETANWDHFDGKLSEMKKLGINAIAGLLHHGSGPKGTHLLDPKFPQLFAHYAGEFAKRYPEVHDYTPINEPLTTARFSGLYGVWYPHAKSDQAFLRALIHQTKATILAMSEIRKVNPQAQFIQTEDLGRASGTAKLQYQVNFENHRRWLSLDLLCGKVNPKHPLYAYLMKNGVTATELRWIADHATPPDIFGINHYLLSNRFLDHELSHHPKHLHGGNRKHRYADVGAVDTDRASPIAPHLIFKEAWDRFHIPLAITEVHASGGRESQLHWFHHIQSEAEKARSLGADLRAITAWSVFGSYDWNSLCTRENRYYESGVFDVRSGSPEPTAIANYIKNELHPAKPAHPLLAQNGWWVRDRVQSPLAETPFLVVCGNSNRLSKTFVEICQTRNLKTQVEGEPGSNNLGLRKPWARIAFGEMGLKKSDEPLLNILLNDENEISPDKIKEIANSCLDLLIDGEAGTLNFTPAGQWSRLPKPPTLDFLKLKRTYLETTLGALP